MRIAEMSTCFDMFLDKPQMHFFLVSKYQDNSNPKQNNCAQNWEKVN